MNSLGIIKMNSDLENEEGILKYKLNQIKELKDKLKHMCEHEIVIKSLAGIDKSKMLVTRYYCPACGMKKCMCDSQEKEVFPNVQIINLTNINLLDDLETLNQIKTEVINNYDFYYDENISETEKAFKLYDAVKDYEYFAQRPVLLERRNKE